MNLQKTHLYYRWGTGRLKTSTESLKKSHGLWLLELKSMCPNSIQCFFFYTEQVCFMSKENTFFFFFPYWYLTFLKRKPLKISRNLNGWARYNSRKVVNLISDFLSSYRKWSSSTSSIYCLLVLILPSHIRTFGNNHESFILYDELSLSKRWVLLSESCGFKSWLHFLWAAKP